MTTPACANCRRRYKVMMALTAPSGDWWLCVRCWNDGAWGKLDEHTEAPVVASKAT